MGKLLVTFECLKVNNHNRQSFCHLFEKSPSFIRVADLCDHQMMHKQRLKRHWKIPKPQNKSEPTTAFET